MTDLYHEALKDYRQKNSALAIEKLSRLLESTPSHEDAREALSVIYYNEKRYDEAIALIRKWIAINPESIMAHTNLSRCYVAKDMIMEAENEQAEARRLGWKEELKAKKMEMPKADHEAQISRFKQVIELDPADVLGYFSLGNAYQEAGKKREALEAFQKAVEVDPGHSSSYFGLGLAYETLGDKKRARDAYLRGTKVADQKGDLMTLKKMESRIRAIDGKI